MAVMQEFREFAVKGNVVDMAVGIIIGATFGAIVRSLVDDVIMPPVGLLLGGIAFENFFIVLKQGADAAAPYLTLEEAKAAGAVTINYGVFLNTLISFLIVAFAVFLLVRTVNRLRREEEIAPQAPTDRPCPYCASTISVKASRCPFCTSEVGAAVQSG